MPKKDLVFSIVIPTYNRPKVLARTLDCLENQECGFPFEVIVVDDASSLPFTDLGFGMGKRKGWKLIRLPQNLGRSASRNRGIKLASGRYVLMLDDDIWAEPQLLQAHYDKQQEISGGVVVGAVPIAREVPHDIWNDYYRDWVESLHRRMERIKDDLTYHYFFTGNVSLPKDLVIRAGMFDEDFKGYSAEDTELGYRLKKMGAKIVYEPKAIGWHYNIETLDSILNKKYQCGRSANILCSKHPELAEEISVAGILAPGRKVYQSLLNPNLLLAGRYICYLLAIIDVRAGRFFLGKLAEAYYAYGLKLARDVLR